MVNIIHCHRQGPQGGEGGQAFQVLGEGPVTAVHIRCGGWIDAVQLSYQKQDGTEDSTDKAGGNGGNLRVLRMREGERITCVRIAASRFVEAIVIETDKGKRETWGNSDSLVSCMYAIPRGHQLVGFFGRAETYLNALGIITVPEAYLLPRKDSIDPFDFLEGLA